MPRTRRDFLVAATQQSAALALIAGGCTQPNPPAIQPVSSTTVDTKKTLDQVPAAEIQSFVSRLKGRAIQPGDHEYDVARQVWNAAYDKHPGLIIRCSGPADVAHTIEFARDKSVLLAVRSGGHSLAGKSTCEGGIVLDLSGLKKIEVDKEKRIARAEAGLTLAEFDQATSMRGLATTSGTEPSTGIAGLTLGGGLGWLMGKHGLTCDNLRSVDMVLADGRVVTASSMKNEDLFWAARGAGANFGVATALEYDLHQVDTILGGVIKVPHDSLPDLLKKYRDFTQTIPDEVGISAGIIPARDGKPIGSIAVCYCGDLKAGEKALQPLRGFRPVLADTIRPMPYLAFQKLGGLPPGLRLHAFVRSSFLTELSDAVIGMIASHAAEAPPMSGSFVIECVHGAVSRTAVEATAFPHRIEGHNFSLHADWTAPAGETRARTWGAGFWKAMQPFVRSAVYSNYLDDEGGDRAKAAYGAHYERLRTIKKTYDPSNFFSLNQNIPPVE